MFVARTVVYPLETVIGIMHVFNKYIASSQIDIDVEFIDIKNEIRKFKVHLSSLCVQIKSYGKKELQVLIFCLSQVHIIVPYRCGHMIKAGNYNTILLGFPITFYLYKG